MHSIGVRILFFACKYDDYERTINGYSANTYTCACDGACMYFHSVLHVQDILYMYTCNSNASGKANVSTFAATICNKQKRSREGRIIQMLPEITSGYKHTSIWPTEPI